MDLRATDNTYEDSRSNRYLISPKDLLEAEKLARQSGLEVIGVYHSHPDHPACPSEFDLERAFAWYSYVIVSVADGEPGDLTSWTLCGDRSSLDCEDLMTCD